MKTLTQPIYPLRLNVTDFGILRSASIDFPREGSLIYVRGVNQDVPHASSNGAGKSTLLNALTWCLYETDTQGARISSSAIRQGQDSCRVELLVRMGDAECTIVRWRFAKAIAGSVIQLSADIRYPGGPENGETLNQEIAQRWITATFGHATAFLASHVYAYEDGYVAYALTSDKEQKSLFDKLLGFDDLETAYQTVAAQDTVLRGRIARLQAGIVRLVALKKAFQYGTTDGNDTQDTVLKGFKDSMSQYTRDLHAIAKDEQRLERLVRTTEKGERRAEMAYHEANDALVDYVSTLRPLEAVIEAQRVRVDAVRGQEHCGVCGASLKGKKWKRLLGSTWKEYLGNVRQRRDLSSHEGQVEDRKKAVAALKQEWDIAVRLANDSRSGLQDLRKRADWTKCSHKECEVGVAQMTAIARKKGRRTSLLHGMLEAALDALLHRNTDAETTAFWKEGFGRNGIRAYRLDQITPRLNAVAADYSNKLFGDGTVVVYSTQNQIKNGEYRDRFSVALQKDGDVLERHSAGQAARRDLIHLLTIATVSNEIHPSQFRFLALDEAFRTIDAAGVYAAVELLRQLVPMFGTVLCIEHDDELASQFDREIVVTRKGGSSYA